jgi:uncharacterized protein
MALLLVSIILAMLLGFAASRASICTVRAVAEVVSNSQAHMLRGIVKSGLWVLVIAIPIVGLVPGVEDVQIGWELSAVTLAGGFLYGTGAALNGACAFSTLNRLADGRLRMVLTLLGFCVGASIALLYVRSGHLALPVSIPLPMERLFPWAVPVAMGLAVWGFWEIWRLWRTRPAGSPLADLLLAPRYRLSTAAALMGLSNGVLYLFNGSWSYSGTLVRTVQRFALMDGWPSAAHWLLFAAMLGGMLISTWQRKSFRIEWRPSPSWARNFAGGTLMGLGAVVIPGGNDTLVLYGIPSLSPHALPAFLAMLGGIFVTLLAMRAVLAIEMTVDCTGDICIAREW